MSIVDETSSVKDAFKSVASEIIKELYRVMVVKKAPAQISSFLPFDGEGAFSGGSQVQTYINGGVVGSSTLLGISGGKTGLMSGSSPRAIMPLKRGFNRKLGVQAEAGSGGGTNKNIV